MDFLLGFWVTVRKGKREKVCEVSPNFILEGKSMKIFTVLMRHAQRRLLLPFLVIACLCPDVSLWGDQKEMEEFPLARRVVDKNAKTLFSEVSESESGVRFVLEKQDGSKDPLKKNPFFVTRRHARGVCAGDFDGDGWDDLFYAHPYGGHRLFRNLGGFTFEDVTAKAGLSKVFTDHWAVSYTHLTLPTILRV